MSKLTEIAEGWRNNLFPPEKMKEIIEQVHKERMEKCNACEFISTKHKTIRPDVHCTKCGCTLAAKTRSLQSACPINEWEAIIKPES